jgi:hypothetical protein
MIKGLVKPRKKYVDWTTEEIYAEFETMMRALKRIEEKSGRVDAGVPPVVVNASEIGRTVPFVPFTFFCLPIR